MRIKKYEAPNMHEAVKLIKKDFGSEAVILHSRTISRGGFMGFFSKEMVEVMAGVDINILGNSGQHTPSSPKIIPYSSRNRKSAPPTIKKPIVPTVYDPEIIKREESMPLTSSLEKKVGHLSQEMDDIRDTLSIIVRKVANSPHPMISPKLILYYKALDSAGIGEEMIVQILHEVETNFKGIELDNQERIMAYIRHKITQMLGSVDPIDLEVNHPRRLVALVGPTGVGKTTTIAKMAANFSLIQKKNVALITIDTFRIAAIEQLRNYANIIGIPMEVVFNLDDFSAALRKFKSADLILIDTAGRSPKNQETILELKKFLKNTFTEVYLCLSVTTKPKDIFKAIQRYQVLGGQKVIFTKLDETESRGVIIDVISKYKKKLTYFTNGQNVPDDFEVGYPNKLGELILSGLSQEMGGE